MFGAKNNLSAGGNGEAGGLPPHSGVESEKQSTLSTPPEYSKPFTCEISWQNPQGQDEPGVFFPPHTDEFFALKPELATQLSRSAQNMTLVLDKENRLCIPPRNTQTMRTRGSRF